MLSNQQLERSSQSVNQSADGSALARADNLKTKRRAVEQNGVILMKELAATYSRGSYTSTTIGKAAFDGRVRDGIGSGHSFLATNKIWLQVEGFQVEGLCFVPSSTLLKSDWLEGGFGFQLDNLITWNF